MKFSTAILVVCVNLAWVGVRLDAAEDTEFFETRIRPVLVKHCYECHSSASAEVKGGLQLDFRDGIRKGGDSGAAVVPGKPTKSLILQALRHESFEMPPDRKLPDRVIADFERWILKGANDPRDKPPTKKEVARAAWQAKLDERSSWWSLQSLKPVAAPNREDNERGKGPVDRFILAKLGEHGLAPAKAANAETLLRRLSFVLTGLPPKPAQVEAFPEAFVENSDAALKTLVDELLETPQFGERFARHWMDVVRYTDTYGYEWDNPAKGSHEYRDYLIRAFNDDIGFDQLIREQVAGDLLPEQRINSKAGVNESMIGPMFYHMGEHRHGNSLNFNGIHQEMVNNKIDAFSKAFLAMTVACARCHDHKLDAISQADYYALAGMFMTPRWTSRVIDAPGKHDAAIGRLKELRHQIRDELATHWKSRQQDLATRIEQWSIANPDMVDKVKNPYDIAYPLLNLLKLEEPAAKKRFQELATAWKAERAKR